MAGIVVLGMHRSGTSAVTKALEAMGCFIGDKDEQLAPQPDNPEGFWERKDVVELNDEILEASGCSWYYPIGFSIDKLAPERLYDFDRRANEIICKLDANETWAIKDPRMCVVWSFWQRHLKDVLFIYVSRSSSSVAKSLHKRNGFSLEYGLALWNVYCDEAAAVAKINKAYLISHKDIVDNHESVFANVFSFLETKGVKLSGATYARNKDDIWNSGLIHHPDGTDETQLSVCDIERANEKLDLFVYDGVLLNNTGIEKAREILKEQAYAVTAAYKQKEIELKNEVIEEKQSELNSLADERNAMLHSIGIFRSSFLGRLNFSLSNIYKLLMKCREKDTVLDELFTYVGEREVKKKSVKLSGRLRALFRVIKYIIKNPYSSLRSFSWYRFKKLCSVFIGKDDSDVSVWVKERFPEAKSLERKPVIYKLDKSFDALELEFKYYESPEVTIIIPVYNQYQMTISCLQSILDHTDDIAYEIIIADDYSSDNTQSIKDRIKGITVVRNNPNLGFLKNCNNAANSARGDYIVLLNNDTNVQPGWLTSLYSTITRDANVGMVGPKLLFEDGVLQEAGGIIWNDASGWNYGRGQNPSLPEYNYVKEVDYISGACVMFRKTIWMELGGFDEFFCPAYYEDTDLAFSMREKGLKVIYQPKSEVVHFEGVSHGNDVNSGIKQKQLVNQKKMLEKWGSVLGKEHFPNGENVFSARDRSWSCKTILVIDHYVPHFDQDAGSKSTYLYLKTMVEMGLNVKFMGANFFPHEPYTEALQQLGIEVLCGEEYAKNWKGWLTDHAQFIDVIYLHRPHISEQFLPVISNLNKRPKVVYFGHDLHYLRALRQSEVEKNSTLKSESEEWKEREFSIFDQVDLVLYPSIVEITEIAKVAPHIKAKAIPLYALPARYESTYSAKERSDFLFVGGFNHLPNVDAVQWFLEDVFPEIKNELPEIKFHIIGSNAPQVIKNMASDDIIFHGFVSDDELDQLYRKCRLVVAPLRFGAGVKGKIVESMWKGVPVLTTTVGAEGIPNETGALMVNDRADDMANTFIGLYEDEVSLNRLSEAGVQIVNAHFSIKAVEEIIKNDFMAP